MNYNLQIRYILIGSSCVGKSSIIQQYIERYFSLSPTCTVGVDFNSKKSEYDISGNTYTVNNHIFDTGGNMDLFPIYKPYVIRAKCVLLVFDLNKPETLYNLKHCYNIIKNTFKYKGKYILVGNKRDLGTDKINKKIIMNAAQEFNCEYIEISAKSKNNVDYLVNKLNRDFIKEFFIKKEPTPIIRPDINNEKDTRCCLKVCNIC